jgi:hypothetical protein
MKKLCNFIDVDKHVSDKKTFKDALFLSEKQIGGRTLSHQFSASKWAEVSLSYKYKRETIPSIFFHLFQQFFKFKMYQVNDCLITSLTF